MQNPVKKAIHLHSSYWTSLRWLESADADNLHKLAVSVRWPHRPADMAQLLQLGKGVLAKDEIDRPIGAGMYLPYGDDFAMIGMMMTLPRLQSGGMGREILQVITDACEGRKQRLNSTTEAWKLYRSVGFRERATIQQYRGFVAEAPSVPDLPQGYEIRAVEASDLPDLLRLDRDTFGASRADLYDLLMDRSTGYVLFNAGEAVGFALCRNFGRGRLIGPLVAPSEALALSLTAPIMRENEGLFLRSDTDRSNEVLGHYFKLCGLHATGTVTSMTKGDWQVAEGSDAPVYCLASHTMG